jgi:hypothetical protein
VNGKAISWEPVAIKKPGECAIDDNEGLADPVLTRFILQARDMTIPTIAPPILAEQGLETGEHERGSGCARTSGAHPKGVRRTHNPLWSLLSTQNADQKYLQGVH